MTEPFYTNVSKVSNVSVCGIHSEESVTAANLFFADLEHLDNIYRASSPEVQIQLADLIDKIYLLVNHDSRPENSDKLALTLDRLQALFWDNVNKRNAKMEQLLSATQEE